MNYIILVKDKVSNKEFRFLNPLTDEDINKAFIPENCRILKESEISSKDAFEFPLINDGITPLTFDINEAFIEFSADKRASNLILAVTLLISGYCSNKSRLKTINSIYKIKSLQERLELLQEKAASHGSAIKLFSDIEKRRESPFNLTDEVKKAYENLNRSKDEMNSVVKDIEILLGESESSVLSDFKPFN